MAILAQDVDKVRRVFRRHRRVVHFGVQIVPELLHVDHGRLARGTRIVTGRQQVLETRPVEEVAAVWDVARNAGRVNVLQTDGAVGPGHVLHALKGTGD